MKVRVSVIISSILTVVMLIVKIFSFNSFSEFLTPLLLGTVWFALTFGVITVLEKNFPEEFNQFFSYRNNDDAESGQDSPGKNFYDQKAGANKIKENEIEDRVDFKSHQAQKGSGVNLADKAGELKREKEELAQKEFKKKWNKDTSKKPNELGPEDFNFEEKKNSERG